MTEFVAAGVWLALAGYALAGVVAALWLYLRLARFDEGAAHAPLYVRALWAPGFIALWPLFLLRGDKPPLEDRP